MATISRTSSARSATRQLWETTRDGLRRRSQARNARRQLAADLATYTTSAEVDDLLATMHGQDEASDAEIRAVVVGNLQENTRLAGIAR